MALKYGIPEVDPNRRICYNCQHWLAPINPHSGWGECELARTNLFRHRLRDDHEYMAFHSSGRWYTNAGCKQRFKNARGEAG